MNERRRLLKKRKRRRERYAVRDDVVGEDGFEPSKSKTTDLQSAPFGHLGIPPHYPHTRWVGAGDGT